MGHFARECPTRKSRLNSSKPISVGGRNASQGSAGNPTQEASRRPKGRKNDSTAGKRERKGSGDSYFHISVPEKDDRNFTVRVQSIAGAPTIQAKITGFHRVFVLDTGSGISIIQPGIYASEVKPTNLSPFGVTGRELKIAGIKDVTFHLNGRKFSHQFCVCSLPTDAYGINGMYFYRRKMQI